MGQAVRSLHRQVKFLMQRTSSRLANRIVVSSGDNNGCVIWFCNCGLVLDTFPIQISFSSSIFAGGFMLFDKIIGGIVGETLCGLPLQHKAGVHLGTPLHSYLFIDSSCVNFSPDLNVNLHKLSHTPDTIFHC